MAKSKSSKTIFVCQKCGAQSPKWLGKCLDCGEWNSLVEERQPDSTATSARVGGLFRLHETKPQRYSDIESQDDSRRSSGIAEFDRVLGGGIVPGSLVLIGGEPGIGKCVTGDTRVLNPLTGDFLPIEEWFHKPGHVLSVDPDSLRITPQVSEAFFDQGVQPIVQLRTRLGRTLRCTASHPVLTTDGWRSVCELQPGARIAAPRELRYFGNALMAEHEVKLIAYILSDGSAKSDVCVTAALAEVEEDLSTVAKGFDMQLHVYQKQHTRAKMYQFVQPLGNRAIDRQDVAKALKRTKEVTGLSWAEWARRAQVSYRSLFGWRRGKHVPGEAQLFALASAAGVSPMSLAPASRDRAEQTTNVARFITSLGLRHVTAKNKHVPDCVFRLPKAQIALFLKTLFTCDGSVFVAKVGYPGLSYSTISERLAQDVQHLLLRFGFISRLRTKQSKVNGEPYLAYEIQLLGVAEIRRFLSEIGISGRASAKEKIAAISLPLGRSTHFDTIPTGEHFWEEVRAATSNANFVEVSKKAGVHIRYRRFDRPLQRSTVAAVATAYASPYLDALGQGDVYWDEVESITSAGEERVFDLAVPPFANFVANDLIIHNSTLLAQVADRLSAGGDKVLYISGEESDRQIKLRGERLGLDPKNLYLLPETCLERIFDEIETLAPSAVIVDSVQTVFSMKLESAPGSVSQVREVAGQFLVLAKNRTVPVFLIGHVTKEGSIAGPKALEHIVDTVLYFEGERHHNHRIVRAVKNRFGAANELGIFEMTGRGLIPVANPSEVFLSERPVGVPGSVVVASMEGSRPLLVELQALVSTSKYGTGKRMTLGVDANRVALLMAMLEKRLGLHLLGDDVFVNVAGGIELDEPAADLGMVAAIASSFKNRPVDERTVLFGEVGLAGEVRAVTQAAVRLREAVAMGFRRAVIPQSNLVGLPELDDALEIIGARSVAEALEAIL